MGYTGESYLEFYKDKGCTNKLMPDIEGHYVLELNAVTDNALMPMSFPIWAKNVGTHNAYDVVATITSSSLPATAIGKVDVIEPNTVSAVLVGVDIPKGTKNNIEIKINVEYSNV